MNIKTKKALYLAISIAVCLAIFTLLYKKLYLLAVVLIFCIWGILFTAGYYGIPLYVKRVILKYLNQHSGQAELSEIVNYCESKNKYFLEVLVRKWISELESKNKIKIQDGIITKSN